MRAAFKTGLAATGMAVALFAVPAMADMLPSEQQRIIQYFKDMGYSSATVLDDEHDVTIVAVRDGIPYAFAYEPIYRRLVPVGQNAAAYPDMAMGEDRSEGGGRGGGGGGRGGGRY